MSAGITKKTELCRGRKICSFFYFGVTKVACFVLLPMKGLIFTPLYVGVNNSIAHRAGGQHYDSGFREQRVRQGAYHGGQR